MTTTTFGEIGNLAESPKADPWKPLPGWPHEVDLTTGEIRSAGGKILATRPNNRPVGAPPERRYQLVTLCAAGRKKTVSVHTCVDAAKHGNWCPPGLEVCHLDDHPGHNWGDNLVRGTHAQNEQMKSQAVRRAAAVKARITREARRTVTAESNTRPVPSRRPWWRRLLRRAA